ncbi:uncharacterized protein J3R85_007059 [Psidium guajava]|nr:uncharacterized protein J3R85_007059 [Psidium guajava]
MSDQRDWRARERRCAPQQPGLPEAKGGSRSGGGGGGGSAWQLGRLPVIS